MLEAKSRGGRGEHRLHDESDLDEMIEKLAGGEGESGTASVSQKRFVFSGQGLHPQCIGVGGLEGVVAAGCGVPLLSLCRQFPCPGGLDAALVFPQGYADAPLDTLQGGAEYAL